MATSFSDDIAATFATDAFGELVTWTPSGGAAVAGVKALRYADDAVAGGYPEGRAPAKRRRFELLKSQVGTTRPANGGRITDAAGVVHVVKDAEDLEALGLWLVTTETVG